MASVVLQPPQDPLLTGDQTRVERPGTDSHVPGLRGFQVVVAADEEALAPPSTRIAEYVKVYTHAHMHAWMRGCMYMYMHVCTYVCVCVWI